MNSVNSCSRASSIRYVDKADDRGDRGAEFLPQKSGDGVFEPLAHGLPSERDSASIFCSSRGSSTGFVS